MDEQALKAITRARAQLVLHKQFFGYLALHLDPKEVKGEDMMCPTMGTDGRFLYYAPEYVNSHDSSELESIVAHEVLHCALCHLFRKGDREPLRWNIAADAVVNHHLTQQGFALPANVIMIPEAATLSAEELYARIKHEEQECYFSGAEGDRAIEGEVCDDHSQWGKGKVGGDEGEGEDNDSEGSGNGDGESSDEMKGIAHGLAEAERMAKQLEDKWKDWASQARQAAKLQGKGMGGLEETLDELFEPKLPWKELLRRFILATTKSNYRLMPPNKKHLYRGLYLPSLYGEEVEVGFAIDTSSSMSDKEVKEGLSEVKGICDQFESYHIHLWQCDYGVQEYLELSPYNFDFPDKIKGRGGTSFVPVFEDIIEKYLNISCLIFVTDGYGTFPDTPPEYPVIWLTRSKDVEWPFGEVIYLDEL